MVFLLFRRALLYQRGVNFSAIRDFAASVFLGLQR